jgi:hypothetical protein
MKFSAIAISTSIFLSVPALAQFPTWDAEQTAVWEFVEQSWVDDAAENGRWPGEYVHEEVVSWGDTQAAPRGVDQIDAWNRFEDEGSDTLYYEITPAAIVVEDDVSIVHYHLLVVTEDHTGERDTTVSRLIEVLIRQDDEWKYISLVGFEPKLNGD